MPGTNKKGERVMRKVVESTLVSADGVIGDPHTWTGEHFGAESVALASEQLRRSDAMVMGRRTYEMFSNIWATPADDYAAAIYNMRKYVFSSTLERADWNNTSIITDDVAAAVSDVKQQCGQDIVLYGHGPVGQALLEANLLDELKLWVHPVVEDDPDWCGDPDLPAIRHLTSNGRTRSGVYICITSNAVVSAEAANTPAVDESR
jgi:dihydrofolate reductase